MPPVEFEPVTQARKQAKAHASDGAAAGIGCIN